MLFRIMEEEQPSHMLVAFDAGKTTFRHKTYKDYKGGRQKTPPELSEQFPLVRELLDAFHITHYELDQYEADDIIGTLARQAEEKNWHVTVISGDKDMLQLVSDRVTVHVTRKGISEVEAYTPGVLKEKMGVSPEQIIDLKALMGDSSDNIPGVPGVGQKTAVTLLNQFTTLDSGYHQIGDISGKKLKENLTNHKDDAYMSKELVTIKRDAPLEVSAETAAYEGYEPKKVRAIFMDLGFKSLVGRLQGDMEEDTASEMPPIEYTVIKEPKADMFTGHDALVIEMLEDNYHDARIEGIGVVNDKQASFIPAQ